MGNKPVIIDPELMLGCKSSFKGSITDMKIWNRPLTLKEVDVYTQGCENASSPQPKFLEWPQFNISYQGKNVKNISISKAEICRENSLSKMTVVGHKMDFYKALNLCHEVGGIMQLPKRNGSLLYDNIASILPPHCSGYFWIPIVQSENNFSSWINAHTINIEQEVGDLPWGFGQPNGKATLLVLFKKYPKQL